MTGWLRTRDDWLAALALVGALGLVVIVRTWVPYDEVFRDGAVVLAGNDPYFYRYWLEQLLASGLSPFEPLDLARMPREIQQSDAMFIWVMWLAAEMVGGDTRAVGLVLAWFPVASAVVTAGLLYVLVWRLTDDRRVAVLAVVVLAVTPAHAFRTMIGFGDHDAFDNLALVLTATALVWLVSMDVWRPWRRVDWWVAVGLLGGAVAAQTLAWRGGPILLIPLAVYVVVAAVSAVRAGRSPLAENLGLLVALVIASGLAAFIHLGPNWAPAYRGFAPLILFGAVVGVIAVSEVVFRFGLPWPEAALGAPIAMAVWIGLVVTTAPSLLDGVREFAAFLERAESQRAMGIGETVSLVGSVEMTLLLFGLLLVVAVPAMAWVLQKLADVHRPAWVAVSAYAWVFLALSVNRVRFSSQLACFTAVFVALGVVWLASQMDYVAPFTGLDQPAIRHSPAGLPSPGTLAKQVSAVVLVVVLLTGVGVAQAPSTMDQITVDDETYDAARWMAGHDEAYGGTHPRNYVFSNWGRNRFYNYEVSGESQSYAYAQRNYREFVSSSDAGRWEEELLGQAGYVVVRPSQFAYPPASMQIRLVERYGSAGDGVPGLAHHRLGYISDNGLILVFTVVPGATIVGNAAANSSVDVATEVRVDGTTFTYRRTVPTDPDGGFEVVVPYPGRYAVGDTEVEVVEAAVLNGETVEA